MAVGFKIKRGISNISLEDGELYLNKEINTIQAGSDTSQITLVPLNTKINGDIIIDGKFVGTSTHAIQADNSVSASIAVQSLISIHSLTADEVLSDKYIKSNKENQTIDGDLVIGKDLNIKGTLITNKVLNATTLNVENNTVNLSVKHNQLPKVSINVINTDTKEVASSLSYNINEDRWQFDKPIKAELDGLASYAKVSDYSETSNTSNFSNNSKLSEESINAKFINSENSNAFINGGNFFENSARIGTKNNNSITFVINSKDKHIFDTNGNIGINTLNPEYNLHVAGDVKIDNSLYVNGTINGNLNGVSAKSNISDFAEVSNKSLYPFKTNGSSIYSVINGDYTANENGNIFIGNYAADKAYQATNSVFIGNSAAQNAINSRGSVFIGYMTGYSAYNAEYSTFIGYEAGESAVNASNSILIGNKAGKNTNSDGIGDNNIIIGNNITLEDGQTNSLNIGGVIFAKNIHSNKSGVPLKTSVSDANVGIGTANPKYTLEVDGTVGVNNLLVLKPLLNLPETTEIGSLAISGSGDDMNIYLYTGMGKTGWRKLFLYLQNDY